MSVSSYEEALRNEQIRVFYRTTPFSNPLPLLLVLMLLPLIVVPLQTTLTVEISWVTWLVVVEISQLILMTPVILWHRRGMPSATTYPAYWQTWYRAANLVSGLGWGSAGILLFPSGDPFHQMFLVLALVGSGVSVANMFAIDKIASLSQLAAMTLPLLTSLLLEGGYTALTIFSLILLFICYNLLNTLRAGERYRENVALRFEAAQRERILQHHAFELGIAKEQADSANRAKTVFLSSMSHELRTPLNAVIGFADLLDKGMLGGMQSAQKAAISHILNSGRHLLGLVNEVLDLTRIESGSLEFKIDTVELDSIVNESIAMILPLANRRHIDINNQCKNNVFIRADAARARQALLNLLSNAVKYNVENGSVIIACNAEAGRIRVSITDTGPGISGEYQQLLFQPYQRLGAEQTATEGTGLGLVISKHIALAMHGDIGFTSQVGRGSCFWIEFPSDVPHGQTTPSGTPQAATTNGVKARHGRVIYIEDNSINIAVVACLFEQLPEVELLTAASAEQGLELIGTCRPDLVLMDINLPGMSGLEALIKLKADPETRSIPVIAVTASASPEDINNGLKAGFLAYFSKPIDIDALLSHVRTIIK